MEGRVNGLHEKPKCLQSSTKQRVEAIKANGAEEVAEIIEEVD